jgi:transcriptional regulator CtsR
MERLSEYAQDILETITESLVSWSDNDIIDILFDENKLKEFEVSLNDIKTKRAIEELKKYYFSEY